MWTPPVRKQKGDPGNTWELHTTHTRRLQKQKCPTVSTSSYLSLCYGIHNAFSYAHLGTWEAILWRWMLLQFIISWYRETSMLPWTRDCSLKGSTGKRGSSTLALCLNSSVSQIKSSKHFCPTPALFIQRHHYTYTHTHLKVTPQLTDNVPSMSKFWWNN